MRGGLVWAMMAVSFDSHNPAGAESAQLAGIKRLQILDTGPNTRLDTCETRRDHSLCSCTIRKPDMMMVQTQDHTRAWLGSLSDAVVSTNG